MMQIESSIAGWIYSLLDASKVLDELWQKGFLPQIHIGAKDVECGYGWHPVLYLELYKMGEKCMRPGCLYDTAGTEEEIKAAMKQEDNRAIHGIHHQHLYKHSERTVFSWWSEACDDSLPEALRKFADSLKSSK